MRKRGPGSCREQEACRCKETAGSEKFSGEKKVDSKEKVSEQEEKLKGADSGGSSLAVPTPSPMDTSKVRAGWGCQQPDPVGNVSADRQGSDWMSKGLF